MSFIKTVLLFPFRLFVAFLKIASWPLRALFGKLFGPPPMMMGGPPVDHSTPEPLTEKTGIKGHVLYILISVFCVIAVIWPRLPRLTSRCVPKG